MAFWSNSPFIDAQNSSRLKSSNGVSGGVLSPNDVSCTVGKKSETSGDEAEDGPP